MRSSSKWMKFQFGGNYSFNPKFHHTKVEVGPHCSTVHSEKVNYDLYSLVIGKVVAEYFTADNFWCKN